MQRLKQYSKKCEAVWCKIYFNKNDFLIVGACYRSQEADENELSQLFDSIRQAANFNCPLLIMGDFHYPDINWQTLQSGPNGKDFVKLVLDCYLEQHVCEPTRLDNILDLVFTAELNVKNNITILPPIDDSDHNVLTWQLDCSGTRVRDNKVRLCFMLIMMECVHFMAIYCEMSATVMWKHFNHIMQTAIEKFAPKRPNEKSVGATGMESA